MIELSDKVDDKTIVRTPNFGGIMKIEQEPKTPKNLFERLQAQDPQRSVEITAIWELKSEAEICEFFEQYVEWLRQDNMPSPESVAAANINYTLIGVSDKKATQMWRHALPELKNAP